jgi:hypothetical protein
VTELTIAIPTFDRNDLLARHVEILLPQVGPHRLLILDNASPVPVAETLCPILERFPAARCEIVRHRHNIGGIANLLRAFELCETDWVWLLGDDDEPFPDAVEKIGRALDEDPEALFLNFSSEIYQRPSPRESEGLGGFVDAIDDFGNVLFLSAGVYRIAALRSNLRLAYHLGYSMMPQLALLLAGLGEDGRCRLRTEQIVHWERPPLEQQWSNVSEALGKMTILDLPMDHAVRMRLARKIRMPRLEDLFVQLLLTAEAGASVEEVQFLFDRAANRIAIGGGGRAFGARRAAYRAALGRPALARKWVDRIMICTKGKTTAEIGLRDRFRRM